MTRESAERLIDTLLGFLALLAFCGALLIACACSPDKPYCNEAITAAPGK